MDQIYTALHQTIIQLGPFPRLDQNLNLEKTESQVSLYTLLTLLELYTYTNGCYPLRTSPQTPF